MKVLFTRWCLDQAGRTSVSVEPARVDCVEEFGPAFVHVATQEAFPAAAKIIMRGKQTYLVQGTVEEVTNALNNAKEKKDGKN